MSGTNSSADGQTDRGLRLTGNLIWPIRLHASTDPTLFLHGAHPLPGTVFGLLPALSPFLVIATGLGLTITLIVSERRARAEGLGADPMGRDGRSTIEAER